MAEVSRVVILTLEEWKLVDDYWGLSDVHKDKSLEERMESLCADVNAKLGES